MFLLTSNNLEQVTEKPLSKGPDHKYFRLFSLYALCPTIQLYCWKHKSSYRQHISEGPWLGSNKNLFTKTSRSDSLENQQPTILVKTSGLAATRGSQTVLELLQSLIFRELLFDLSGGPLEDPTCKAFFITPDPRACSVWRKFSLGHLSKTIRGKLLISQLPEAVDNS